MEENVLETADKIFEKLSGCVNQYYKRKQSN